MGQITNICSHKKQRSSQPPSRISRLNNGKDENVTVQKLLFKEIADVFPYKYLGKGLYGTTVEVYVKQRKQQKFAQKIIPEENLIQNYICYEPQIVDKIMMDPILKHKIVKVHAYSINNQKNKMYLIMDLMKKSDLYFHLSRVHKKNGRFFSQKAIKRIAYELLEILQKFHSYNLIFRNFRSENIFIKENGKLAVSDFFFAINGAKCHTYYGAAEYAPPEVYYMQKQLGIVNQGMIRNLNQISDGTESRDLRMSPDLRRYNINTKSSFYKLTKSCDLKDQIQQNKFKSKQSKDYENQKEKSQKLSQKNNLIKMNRIDSKDSLPESRQESVQHSRRLQRNLTTFNMPLKEIRDREKHLTYTILEEPFGQNSQVKEDAVRVGPGFKVQFEDNRFDTEEDIDSNATSVGFGQAYDRTVDFWMLGVLLFELIFGRTPFEKWKGTCDVLSKTPACPSYAENLNDLEHHVKNRQIQQIWPKQNLQNSQPIISPLEKSFIESLLIRQPQKRKTVPELIKDQFLSDCDTKTPMEQLIYDKIFEPDSFEKEMRSLSKNRESGMMVNRTILKKTCKSNIAKGRVTQKLFDHEKSVNET